MILPSEESLSAAASKEAISMSFVQIIQFETTKIDEIRQLDEEWYTKTAGHHTVRREILTRDRSNPDRYMAIVEFDSYEEAMRNSELPETTAIANAYQALCSEPPTFINLDVIEVRTT
jgi:quinol monooxygenase YgiN